MDVSNFSDEFTQMPPTDSPAVVPPNYDKIFKGYSYIAPSVLFTRNIISDELLKPVIRQDDTSALVRCQINGSPFFQVYDIDLKEMILGDGSFSVCRRCVHKGTNKEYAVKIVSRKIDCTQEINLLRACQGHPNIVNLQDVVMDEGYTYLVFELLKGGELLDRIRKKSKFTESEASAILRKLVSAVSFMHSRGVVHRDLKPENLLFTSDDEKAELKVVDFGFARLKQEKEGLHTPCFTLHYAAPEVLNGDPKGYDENCDLWSLGVILYTMLCGKIPFNTESREDSAAAVMARIKGGEFDFCAPSWKDVSDKAKAVVSGLLTVDPAQRLTMIDLRSNSWVQGSQPIPHTPLMTPDVLCSSSSAEKCLQTTFNAFHKAQREGFRLQDVLTAKLAQRRRLKKSSSDNNSTSSSFTSEGSLKSGPSTPLSRPKLSLDLKKTDEKSESFSDKSSNLKVSSSSSEQKDQVFNFGESRVTEYLRTMSSSPLDPGHLSPSNLSTRASDSSGVTLEKSEPEDKQTETVRVSTTSSGIVVNTSTESKEKIKQARVRKTYIRTRQSERIRRLQRREIDYDPEPFMVIPPPSRKRKMKADQLPIQTTPSNVEDSPKSKIRKKVTESLPQVRHIRKAKRNKAALLKC